MITGGESGHGRLIAHPQQLAVGQDDIARSDDASDEECAGDCHRDNVANETSQKQAADEELLPLPEPLKMTVPVGVKRSRNQVVCSEPQEAHQLSNLECGVSEMRRLVCMQCNSKQYSNLIYEKHNTHSTTSTTPLPGSPVWLAGAAAANRTRAHSHGHPG